MSCQCYRVPRGEALKVFQVPPGVILSQDLLQQSTLLTDIIHLGAEFLEHIN